MNAMDGWPNGRVRIKDRDACMECGACARNCPSEALKVRLVWGVPLRSSTLLWGEIVPLVVV